MLLFALQKPKSGGQAPTQGELAEHSVCLLTMLHVGRGPEVRGSSKLRLALDSWLHLNMLNNLD